MAENNLKLNSSKSVELIIHRPRTRIENCNVPPPSDGVAWLNSITILGVIVTDTSSFEMHISGVVQSNIGRVGRHEIFIHVMFISISLLCYYILGVRN